MSDTRKIDYLTEDAPLAGQSYVCMSFLSPEGIRNCKVRGLKIRGVFATRDEADRHAEEIQKIDSDFHVFVGEVGKWLPWDPDPNSVTDQNYKEEELQKVMQAYNKNREQVKKLEKERKDELIKNAKADNTKQSTINRLRKKLEAKNANKVQEVEEVIAVDPTIKEREDLIAEKTNLIKDTESELNNVKGSSLEDNLSKISELYKQLND